LHVHCRLDHGRAVGLRNALGHPLGHRGGGVADIDLAARDVVLSAVERRRLGEAGDRVLGRGVRSRIGPRRVRRQRAVVDDPPASAATFSRASLRRPASETWYPSLSNASPTALPTPLPAPVTIATFLSISIS